jgi:MFS family permease
MTLGMAGQVGIWGIGFWSPELIRGAQFEQRRRAANADAPNLAGLAHATAANDADAQTLFHQWRAEDDKYVGRAAVLQNLCGMLGIYAFTWFTARAGRRAAFAVAYLLGMAATLFVFGCLRSGADSYWMMPLLGFGVACVFGGFAIYFPELFPTRLRSTGIGFCYNVARYVTALGPLVLGKLALVYAALGWAMPLRPAAMSLALIYVVGVCVLPFAPETRGRPLQE